MVLFTESSDLKIKKEGSGNSPQYNYGSAFLGPTLWDDTFDFNLEYMDLDEFLSENNIPASNGNKIVHEAPILNQPEVLSPPANNGN